MRKIIGLSLAAIAGLGIAATAFSGGPPDILSTECVNTSDRANVRTQRNQCDDDATNSGYNVGIFRPTLESDWDSPEHLVCEVGSEMYTCLGAPHQEAPACPAGEVCEVQP